MKFLGVDIKHPTPQGLGIAAAIILLIFLVNVALAALGLVSMAESSSTMVFFAAGVIASAFGISPVGGWRPCVLLMGICGVVYGCFLFLTG